MYAIIPVLVLSVRTATKPFLLDFIFNDYFLISNILILFPNVSMSGKIVFINTHLLISPEPFLGNV